MDVSTTFKIFVIKTLKEKKYFWARNVFFVVFPLLFIITYIFSGAATSQHGSPNKNSGGTYPSITEVKWFL